MSTSTPLCQLPTPAVSGCGCGGADTTSTAPLVPLQIDNAPGLAAIPYRIGTFTSFRQAMLDRVADPALLISAPNPFANWKPGTDGDYHTRLIELWAYLGDILTFYQERIANEAYIGTATQLDSVIRLSQLIAYQPSPGSGASGYAAFNAAKGKIATLPTSFRIGSKAQGSTPAAVFETSSAVTVRSEHNSIPLSSVAPTNQFATLSSFAALFAGTNDKVALTTAVNDIFPTAGMTYLKSFPSYTLFSAASRFQEALAVTTPAAVPPAAAVPAAAPAAHENVAHSFSSKARAVESLNVSGNVSAEAVAAPRALSILSGGIDRSFIYTGGPIYFGGNQTLGDVGVKVPRYLDPTNRPVVLAGVNTRLKAGDYVLTVDSSTQPVTVLYQLSSVTIDKAANTTTITWSEEAGKTYTNPVSVYAMRVKASPFGSNAPAWISLPPNLNGQLPVGSPPVWTPPAALTAQQGWPVQTTPYPNYDDPDSAEAWMPFLNNSSFAYFDSVYDSVRATPQSPGWLVLLPGGALLNAQYFQFTDVASVNAVGYSISTKVTRVTLQSSQKIPTYTFGIRDTIMLSAAELLTLQNDLPLPDLVQGSSIILAGLFPNLQSGQSVVLQGNLYSATSTPAAEVHTLLGQPVLDSLNTLTTVTLDKPLTNSYSRASSVLLANVVAFTQGETVKDEILGNGTAAANQTFALAKKPLTYLPSTDPESTSPVQSTLIVSVNGVAWQEESRLGQSGPDAQQFTISNDATQQSTVTFGDGVNGAVPPTGVQNVHARYRVGLGTSGNVATGGVAQLIDSVPGVSTVSNPLPSAGGANPDTVADTRGNAPATVRAFNRAVSVADYAALALTFPGISKATASTVSRDASGNALAQSYIQLTIATNDQNPADQSAASPLLAPQLRQFLDQRRDPNIPLRIVGLTRIYVDVFLTVDLLPTYPRQATMNAIMAALNPGTNPDGSSGFFSFGQLDFGESLFLSSVYALVQGIPGVAELTITRFQPTNATGNGATVTPADIVVGPTQIAAINNDPANPQFGQLILTLGTGGFADQ